MRRGSLAPEMMRWSVIGAVFLSACGASAYAADLGPAPVTAAPPSSWWSDIKFHAQIEGGFTGNPDNPINSVGNFGQLFTDKANEFMLNQILLTAQRDVDLKKAWDVGFKFQFMYGSDARYTHFLGELDHVTDDRNQLDIVENWIDVKTPWLGKGGMEFKIGQYPTLLGYEVIDPRGNNLYSHGYVFNSLPLKHTGVLTTTHVSDALDIYAGADTGVNTTFGREGDNNGADAFLGGFGLHLDKGNWNIIATTHIGPENPNNNKDIRQYYDVVSTYKINDKWMAVTDADFIHDDVTVGRFSSQDAWGLAQYFIYSYNDSLTFVLRGEFFRDPEGFFVAAFPGNLDFVNFEAGDPAVVFGSGPNTYSELTFGVNIKPFAHAKADWLKTAVLRPEVRWDHSYEANAFDPARGSCSSVAASCRFTDNNQVTLASDFVITW